MFQSAKAVCFVLLFLTLLALAMAAPTEQPTKQLTDDEQWAKFKVDFNRNYKTTEEEAERKAIFIGNLRTIEKHNSEGHSWTMGVNNFADMKPHERQKFCCGAVLPTQSTLLRDEDQGQS